MYFIFIIYSLLKSEHLYIVKLQGIAIKYIGMIFSQFIAIYISIEMFYIWYYKHKYCLNYGNQFILKHFEFFSKNYNSNIFFNLIHTYYNNNNIQKYCNDKEKCAAEAQTSAVFERCVCSPYSNDSYQCPIKVTKVSCNEKISVQDKCKQPNGLENLKKILFDFLNFWIKINFAKKNFW